MLVRLHNGYTQVYAQTMQHTHMNKAVTVHIEAKKLLSRRRQSNYRQVCLEVSLKHWIILWTAYSLIWSFESSTVASESKTWIEGCTVKFEAKTQIQHSWIFSWVQGLSMGPGLQSWVSGKDSDLPQLSLHPRLESKVWFWVQCLSRSPNLHSWVCEFKTQVQHSRIWIWVPSLSPSN